jgi:hypothetical protein
MPFTDHWEVIIEWEPGVTYAQRKSFARKFKLLRTGWAGQHGDKFISTAVKEAYQIENEILDQPEVRNAWVRPPQRPTANTVF